MNDETWQIAPGTSGRYSASTHGRVRSNYGLRGSMVLRPFFIKGHPYLRVNLTIRTGYWVQRGVHQAVASAFLGVRPEGLMVNHIDGNKTNNRAENLEYVTPKRNAEHAAGLGNLARRKGERNGTAKLRLDMVMDIKSMLLYGFSPRQLAEHYPVGSATIRAIRAGKLWGWVPPERWTPEGYLRVKAIQDGVCLPA